MTLTYCTAFQGGLLIVCHKLAEQFAINYAVLFIAMTHFGGQELTFPMPQTAKGQRIYPSQSSLSEFQILALPVHREHKNASAQTLAVVVYKQREIFSRAG